MKGVIPAALRSSPLHPLSKPARPLSDAHLAGLLPMNGGFMSETDPVGTGEGSLEGSPAPVATGDMVPKERFDGLMSTMNRKEQEYKNAISALEARIASAGAVTAPTVSERVVEVIPDDIKDQIEELGRETKQVYQMYRDRAVAQLLEKYPYATSEDAHGTNPDDWESSLRVRHEQVKSIIERESLAVEKQVADRYRKEFGVPLSISAAPVGAKPDSEVFSDRLNAAREAGDMAAVTKLLLLSPLTDNES